MNSLSCDSDNQLFLKLRMLWLEITNACNEHCGHCYNDSGPERSKDWKLPKEKWFEILREGRELGASEVQFIGGEPTLEPWLIEGLKEAYDLGYEKIELYTNGTKLDEDLLECLKNYQIHVAVSIYSFKSVTHDQITNLAGSHDRTMKNVQRLKLANIPLRLAVVSMPKNKNEAEKTIGILKGQGFKNVDIDNVRAFGRAMAITKREPKLEELCGQCWNGTFCITPQGEVSPCIMSRNLKIGDVNKQSLKDILFSRESFREKKKIYDLVWKPRNLVSRYEFSPILSNSLESSMLKSDALKGIAAMFGTPILVMPDDDFGVGLPEGCLPEHFSCNPKLAPRPEHLGVFNCMPNSPYPQPSCAPYSTPSNPCGPYTCMPGSGPCFPGG